MKSNSSHDAAPRAAELRLSTALAEELVRLSLAGYPEEVCGVLLGLQDAEATRVATVRQVANLRRERARDRYEMDPAGQLEASLEARRLGLDIVGVWHTHPDHPPRPSTTDLAAAWEGWSYLIVAVSGSGETSMRSWRLTGESFDEEPIVVVDLPDAADQDRLAEAVGEPATADHPVSKEGDRSS